MLLRMRLLRHLARCHVADRCLCSQPLPECARILLSPPNTTCCVTKLTFRSYATATITQQSVELNNSASLVRDTEISEMIQSIETSVKNVSRVNKSVLKDFLSLVEEKGYSLDDNMWLLLLRCCGNLLPDEHPSVRVSLTSRVWELLKHTGCTLNVDHYNALLHSYLENRHAISLTEFLQLMGSVKPTESTYLLLLELMCEDGNLDSATDVISYMKKENLPASERMFNALLKCNAKLRDTESCKRIHETMRAAHIPLSVDTFVSLLEGFGEAGDIENVKRTYTDAMESSVTFSEKHIINILRKTAVSTHNQIFGEVLHLFRRSIIEMTPNVVNFITHLVYLGKVQEAYILLKAVSTDTSVSAKSGEKDFGSFLIQDMVETNQPPSTIVSICKNLEDTGCNRCALLKAAEAALSLKKVEIALGVFHAMKSYNLPLRPHYFWPLFVTEARASGEKGVFSILCQMKELGVNPDSDTLQDYVFPYCSLSDPVSLVRKLQDLDLKLSLVMAPLLVVLLKTGCLQHAEELCKKFNFQVNGSLLTRPLAVAYMITNDVTTVISLIKMLSQNCSYNTDVGGYFILDAMTSKRIKIEAKQITSIIQAFKKENIYISYAAADSIYYQLQRHIRDTEELKLNRDVIYQLVKVDLGADPAKQFNNHMVHPRHMNLEELESHLVELQSKNMNTRGVLRKLLQMYCSRGDFQNAVRIKKEFETAGYEFSPGMCAALFDVHVKNNSLKDAEKYCTILIKKFPDFKLDEYKVIDYAALLIASGKETDALHILRAYASSHKIKNAAEISRNCWKLLNTLAEKKNPNSTKKMLEQMVYLGYCSVTNVLLGPVIRTYLICDDIHGAVAEYVHCGKELHKTPLQHELLCQLVSHQQYESLLKQVIDATKLVHGTDATLVAHAAAVADAGSQSQLRQMLMDRHFNWSLFTQRCKRFVDEKKLSALEKIATACEGLSHSYTPFIYTCMLEIYCRQGDCEGALRLWTSAQEANIVPEPEFFTKLASLLKSHKYDVPFTVPEVTANNESK